LYEEFWKIYTKSDRITPQYVSGESNIEKSIIGEGTSIFGEVYSSVIGSGVTIGKGAIIRDSIIMKDVEIGDNCIVDKAIIAESVQIGNNVELGIGEEVPNKLKPGIYAFGLVTVGENSVIPSNVKVGKNTAISGVTVATDYPNSILESGETLIKAGDR
jgi:glucose-1-phosphate adenylyltransferase